MQSQQKGDKVDREQSLGRKVSGLWASPFPLSSGADNAFAVFLVGDIVKTCLRKKKKEHSDLIRMANDSKVFTVKSFYMACLIFPTSLTSLLHKYYKPHLWDKETEPQRG